jgi:zinc protease
MTVILKEVHAAPLVSWWVLYRIGSRNERTGQTGISHWVEHMMFKGTDQFPRQELEKMIDRQGGFWNAQTSFDYTAYFETMPADRIDLALRLEADRMQNVKFLPEEVESERTVIISERQGLENSPTFWLGEEISAAAFRVHGYHHEIIGDMADLQTMTRDDLYEHYRAYYAPNNAIAVAVGAFDSAEMLERIKALYGSIPPRPLPRAFARPEPEQNGERRVRVERPGMTAFLEFAYRAPAAQSEDYFKLAVLMSVLSGPSGPGGSNIDNKTSRLYRALVESGIAASVDGSLYPSIDPHLMSFSVTVAEGRTLEEAEAALEAQIERVRSGDITPQEVAKAKKQARASFAYSTESVTGQAFWLAFCENIQSYEWFETYIDRLDAVTHQDVLDAARQYLQPKNRVVGLLIPTGMGDDDEELAMEAEDVE